MVFRFHHAVNFSELGTGPDNGGLSAGPQGDTQRRQLEAFVLAFPTHFASIVGQQITLTVASSPTVAAPHRSAAPARRRR